jgi:hypothetical protein
VQTKNGFVQDEILVCRILLTLNSEFFLQLDFASSMGFVILLPKKKVMCPCSELAILRKFANMAFIYWLLSQAQVSPHSVGFLLNLLKELGLGFRV